jgi:hypothetical protein
MFWLVSRSKSRTVYKPLPLGMGFMTLLGFFAVVAVRLLQLGQISRSHPQLPAQHFVPPIMLNILVARLGLLSKNLSLGGVFGNMLPVWEVFWDVKMMGFLVGKPYGED